MPSLGRRRASRSVELAVQRERLRQKKVASWERLKAQVAAKYSEGGVS